MATLELEQRVIFAERVANINAYSSFCEPGPGDVDRAIRQALIGLWIPPATEEVKASSRWDRASPKFEQASKRAF